MKSFASKWILPLLLMLPFIAAVIFAACDPEPECDPPINPVVTSVDSTSVTFSWTPSTTAPVRIRITPAPNPPGPFETTDTTITINGLTPNTNYEAEFTTLCPDGSVSDPVVVPFRTSSIIIIDVVIQVTDLPSGFNELCVQSGGGNSDVFNSASAINWNTSLTRELLHIKSDAGDILIAKEKTGTITHYYALAEGEELCDVKVTAAPTSIVGSILRGSDFDVELQSTKGVYNSTSKPGATYNMYR
jgi:hypothetical protein